MIDHASVPVSDIAKSKEFYTALIAPLGYSIKMDLADQYHAVGYGTEDRSDFWIAKSDTPSNVHLAFAAGSKEEVDAFHAAGLSAGGKDNGAPGYRTDYAPNYYGAFIYDLDGSNIEAVFRDPSKPSS